MFIMNPALLLFHALMFNSLRQLQLVDGNTIRPADWGLDEPQIAFPINGVSTTA